MALRTYRVVGALPIRDAVTKESVCGAGCVSTSASHEHSATDLVQLDDEPVRRSDGRPWAGTRVDALIVAGHVKPYEEAKPAPAVETGDDAA